MKKHRRDSGFSLVELIIVIAIMVVLVGLLAPQFVKYVEKSRVAVDVDNAQQIGESVAVMCTDDEYTGDDVDYILQADRSGTWHAGGSDDLICPTTGHVLLPGIDGFPVIKAKVGGGKDGAWFIRGSIETGIEVYISPVINDPDSSHWIMVYPTADGYR